MHNQPFTQTSLKPTAAVSTSPPMAPPSNTAPTTASSVRESSSTLASSHSPSHLTISSPQNSSHSTLNPILYKMHATCSTEFLTKTASPGMLCSLLILPNPSSTTRLAFSRCLFLPLTTMYLLITLL